MKLLVKNMVSIRCKMIVKSELQKLDIDFISVELGEVTLPDELGKKLRQQFGESLQTYGLQLMEDRKSILIEKIKNIVIEIIHYSEEPLTINFSNYLSSKLHYDYNYLSNLFSEVKGITLEHYIIAHKIERVKELLVYEQLTLTEIANDMGYSSVAHLSKQFKKVTGLTPSFFKNMRDKRFNAFEDL